MHTFDIDVYPQRWIVATFVVGLENSHICKNIMKNGESQRYSWEQKKKKKKKTLMSTGVVCLFI